LQQVSLQHAPLDPTSALEMLEEPDTHERSREPHLMTIASSDRVPRLPRDSQGATAARHRAPPARRPTRDARWPDVVPFTSEWDERSAARKHPQRRQLDLA